MRHCFVLGVVVLLLAGCGGDDEAPPATTAAAPPATLLDTARVEQEIRRSIRRQRDVAATVTCPREVRQARGVNFVCSARTAEGETPFAVVQTDDAGTVTYTAAQPAPAP
ncbi:DUF4333 domain-containing protein [Paraconexibacter algicola]|uniref:DUF4333 domain-containing protein n=1 Tax=Paraconexibacter algicola TaxID=2133960 RepID=A0A2T4UKK7_9ACTN|nr:DUF4333 domain-containing protein [Paraconexibacter algicola]PTL59745.1 hypothetical protein C7Y72_08800 [Paraconexibacter algicola]